MLAQAYFLRISTKENIFSVLNKIITTVLYLDKTRMTAFIKAKLKKSDLQTNIDK